MQRTLAKELRSSQTVHFGSAKSKLGQKSASETGFQFKSSLEARLKMLSTAFGELIFETADRSCLPPYAPLSDDVEVESCCEERREDGDPRNKAGGRKSALGIERGVSGFQIEDEVSTVIEETFEDASGNN